MRVSVEFLPRGPYPDVVLLVDVLRASTSIALLFERGAREVWVTPSLRVARELEADLALGEREGIPPEGFFGSTSPSEILGMNLSNKRVVYTSENLPGALRAVKEAPRVYLAAFVNARAAVETALRTAREAVTVVAAGHRGREALDDALAAGFLAKKLLRAQTEPVPDDGTRIATALLKAYPDPQEALWASESGQLLVSRGFTEDLAQASVIGRTSRVPFLAGYREVRGQPVFTLLADEPA